MAIVSLQAATKHQSSFSIFFLNDRICVDIK